MAGIIALRIDAAHQPGIGIEFRARILAHAVGDDPARLGGRGDHPAPRAHAKAVDGAAIAAMMGERVGGRAKIRMPGAGSESGSVDPRLWMFDSHADREWFRLDMHAALVKHGKGIARAMA